MLWRDTVHKGGEAMATGAVNMSSWWHLSAARNQREKFLLSFLLILDTSPWDAATIIQGGVFPPQLNFYRNPLHKRHAQRCVSIVILNLLKLIVMTSSHNVEIKKIKKS